MAEGSGDIPLNDIVTSQPKASSNVEDTSFADNRPGDPKDRPRLTRLGPLENAQQLRIKQKIRVKDVCGACCGCEAEKKFSVEGPEGDVLYWAREKSDCCDRFIFANVRPLRISIEDQTGAEVLNFRRPLNCAGCCCWFCYPKCTQKITVNMGDQAIGYIRERATWFYPVFHIFSNDGTREMKVRGLPCHDLCCEDVLYSVTNMDGATVSTITRKWLGCCREALLDVDQFIVTFHKDLSTAEKALILASTFLIELIYYEYA